MFWTFPVIRLSTQMTRWPLPSRSSQRCDPRKPAPPVTTEVVVDDVTDISLPARGRGGAQAPVINVRDYSVNPSHDNPFFSMGVLLFLAATVAVAQEERPVPGDVVVAKHPAVVVAIAPPPELALPSTLRLAGEFESADRVNAADALARLPGVTADAAGSRNDRVVRIRGYDVRQVDYTRDGLPLASPYDGNLDLGAIGLTGLDTVRVEPGVTTARHGPAALGGAVALETVAPTNPAWLRLGAGARSGDGHEAAAAAGVRRPAGYAWAGAQAFEQDYVRVSDDFEGRTISGGARLPNSDRRQRELALKLGATPGASDEWNVLWRHQEGDKGVPPYAGSQPGIQPRYWRWPQLDADGVALAGGVEAVPTLTLGPRLYYTGFRNTLEAFDDDTYTTQKKPGSFTSRYNDEVAGAALDADCGNGDRHRTGLTLDGRVESHQDRTSGLPAVIDRDLYGGAGLDYAVRPVARLEAQAGARLAARRSVNSEFIAGNRLEDQDGNATWSADPYVTLAWRVAASNRVYAALSRQSRFPTMKERYVYQAGKLAANPELDPERAVHAEVGCAGQAGTDVAVQLATFVSRVQDSIQRVDRAVVDLGRAPVWRSFRTWAGPKTPALRDRLHGRRPRGSRPVRPTRCSTARTARIRTLSLQAARCMRVAASWSCRRSGGCTSGRKCRPLPGATP